MDVIVIGMYSEYDIVRINEVTILTPDIEIVWDYEKYNIVSYNGIKLLEQSYQLIQTGILVKRERDETFSSFH